MNEGPDPMNAAHEQAALLDAYLAQLTTQRKLSKHTVDAYGRDLLQLADLCGAQPWADINHQELRRHTSKLHAGGLSARSIARKLSAWRGFFDWLASQTALEANPVAALRAPRRPASLPRALSVDNAVQLVATPPHGQTPTMDACNRAMFELLYSSGLRVSELTSLDLAYSKVQGQPPALGWVDFDSNEVIVTGKGNKMRKVPVGKHAIAALQAWLACRPAPVDGSAALFVSGRGSRMSPRVVQLRLKAHAQAVGTPANVHPHVLRHSFATHVLQSSSDLRAVQEMLGHSSISSTQVYTALDFQHLALVYDQTHPRAKIKSP
jgi:integrase/recombinase XerC